MSLVLVAAGVLLLFVGGELLVRNAALLARALELSPLVVGLTVVAFGTSSPELAASLAAALAGAPGIAYGNVVGSNIANLGLILALAALIRPIRVELRVVLRELPFMILVALLLVLVVWDGSIARWEGGLFLLLLAFYFYALFLDGEPLSAEELAAFEAAYGRRARFIAYRLVLVGLGVVLLALGAEALVRGATAIARALGVADEVIGLTLVAVGTSLPELAAALVAAIRREGDILVGNVVGSNVFNVLGILGTVALVRPLGVRPGPELAYMLGFSLLAWLFFYSARRLSRSEGVLLLALYAWFVGRLM